MDLKKDSSIEEEEVLKENPSKDDEKVEVVDSKDEDKDVILEPLIDDESEDSQEEITSNENKEKDEEFIPETEKLGPMVDYESIKSSKDIDIPLLLIDQVIGHEEAVETIKKAAKQRRNVLLIGNPGVGKSMLAKGMAELLPPEVLQDVLVYPNPDDQNNPLIRTVPAGQGKIIVNNNKASSKGYEERKSLIIMFAIAGVLVLGFFYNALLESIIAAAFIFLIGLQIKPKTSSLGPKLLVNNADKRFAPFFDGTGSHAGALLGDVRHDPYQSGGLGTPPHERVEPGMIHKAHNGVLYIDEIGTMRCTLQCVQELEDMVMKFI